MSDSNASILDLIQRASTPNWFERAVSVVSPSWGLSRMRARATMTLAMGGAWTGARRDIPSLKNFLAISQSSDDEQRWDRETLVARSADLERNDPLAGGAITEMVLSVVGTGLSVRPEPNRRILGWTQDQAVEWAEGTKQAFNLWAQDARECDLARRRNFYQQQVLAFRTIQGRGDCFALLPRRTNPGGAWALKVQLVEGDRCSQPRGMTESEAFNQGVEVDPKTGAPITYWFCTKHPSRASAGDWVPRPAFKPDGSRNVLHLMHEHRIDLRRGYPLLAPVIEPLRQMNLLSESELAAAVVTSFFAVAVEKTGPGPGPLGLAKAGVNGSRFTELGPAIVADLLPGEKIQNIAPTRPNGAFDPFWRSLMGQIAMRTGIPPEVLLKKYESSYTAARAALLQFWKFVQVERENLLAPDFCQPIYEAWLAEAIAAGTVEGPGFFASPLVRAALSSARWVGDNPPILDPLKEVIAAQELINYSLSTHDEQTMRLTGGDFEVNVENLQREVRLRRDAGLISDLMSEAFGDINASRADGAGGQNPDEQDEEDAKTKPGNRRAQLFALAMKETH